MTETSKEAQLAEEWFELNFDGGRSIRYHMRRQAFFERWQRVTGWISVFSGTAAFAAIVGEPARVPALIASSVIVAAQALDLFVNPGDMARKHSDLRRRFIELESDMVACENPTGDDLRRFKRARLAIEAEEPPLLMVLNDIVYNDMLTAVGYTRKDHSKRFISIPSWKRMLAQFYDFHPTET